MIKRKITRARRGSLITVIPKTLADVMGLMPGTDVEFQLTDDKKLLMSPVAKTREMAAE